MDFSSKKTRSLLITVAALLVVTIAAGIYYLNTDAAITVLAFTGETKEDVQSWMSKNKLSDSRVSFEYQYDETAAQDSVISQSIAEGKTLSVKDVLVITLSNGPDPDKEVTLPDFTGKSQDEVSKWFDDNLFTNVTYEFMADETVAKDVFLKLSVSGTSAKRSDAITVTISSGKTSDQQDITVPDFSSYSKANIQAWAKTNSITVTFTTQASDTVAAGKVLSQSVKAGATIKTGGKLAIVLSGGKSITVSSFVGKQKSEAEAWIKTNSLKGVYLTYYDGTAASGVILTQTPAEGSVSAGASISFHVSAGLVPVENYTGKTKSEFTAYIASLNAQNNNSANIKYTATEEESSETAGKILSQTANGNAQSGTLNLAPGSTVTIKVAVGKTVSVTSKSGSSEADFKSYLSSLGMSVGNRTESYSDSVAAGSVISNDTGSKAAGSSVNYVVSLGAYAPDAALYKEGASYSTLSSTISGANSLGAGWSVSASYEGSASYASGLITSACSVSGKSISCKVSSGKVITVAKVDGMTKDAAVAALSGLNVTTITQSSYNDTYAAGLVMAQSISAGSTVAEGSSITLTLSRGPHPACSDLEEWNGSSCAVTKGYLPSISSSMFQLIGNGKTYAEVRDYIVNEFKSKGFTNITVNDLTGSDNPDNVNQIKSISPSADGTIAALNTAITITIFRAS